MLGKLPPEIAKLIHLYIFEDVLKELVEKTKRLLRNTEMNIKNKYSEHRDIHIFSDVVYGIVYSGYGIFYVSGYIKLNFTKRKFNFLKIHSRETIIFCHCGERDSIYEYNEGDFLDNGVIKCIHEAKGRNS